MFRKIPCFCEISLEIAQSRLIGVFPVVRHRCFHVTLLGVSTLVYMGDKGHRNCPARLAQALKPHSTWISFGGSLMAGTAIRIAHF